MGVAKRVGSIEVQARQIIRGVVEDTDAALAPAKANSSDKSLGTYSWGDDKYALYGEGSLNTSFCNFADSYTVKDTVGFKVHW